MGNLDFPRALIQEKIKWQESLFVQIQFFHVFQQALFSFIDKILIFLRGECFGFRREEK